MPAKQLRVWAYNLALLALTAAVASQAWPWLASWPSPWLVLGFVLFQLLVWKYGFPVPSMGMISMERVPQVAAFLLFPVEVAAAINALPALLWPFLNHRYRQGSWHFGLQRAIHNACMLALMTVAAAWAYSQAGGSLPLQALDWRQGLALVAGALAMQVVNMSMMVLFLQLDGRAVRRLVGPAYLLADLLFVPIGVLTALVWVQGDSATFLLYIAFVVLTVWSMHEIVEARSTAQVRLQALDAATTTRQALSGSRRVEDIVERLMSQIGALFDYHTAFVALHEAARGEFDIINQVSHDRAMPRMSRPDDVGVAGHVLRTGEPLLIDDWASAPQAVREVAVLDEGETPGCVLIVPIKQAGSILGLISVQHLRPHRFGEADKNALLAIAEDLAPVLADARTFQELDAYREQLERLVSERTAALEKAASEREELLAEVQQQSALLERQSREDVLTGLANRRHFEERFDIEITRARRHGHSLSLALIDIDHFKRINDCGGHALGDEVLRRIGAMMRDHFRSADLVARIGGEEFAVLFPDTGIAGARTSVESLRDRVHRTGAETLAAGLTITISAGLAMCRASEDRDAFLRRADAKLYAAKAGGRNRVTVDELDLSG